MRGLRERLTYANVIATLALFIALGGGALAAIHLGKNSVGAKQLKNNSVTTQKIKNGAVTSEKLATGSVSGAQLQSNSITAVNVNSGSLTGAEIADGSLSAANLAPGTIPTQTPRTARLQSGETITGFIAIEAHASLGTEFFGTDGRLGRPLLAICAYIRQPDPTRRNPTYTLNPV
jgi:hypothetical protein